ncbi:Transcription factor IIIC, subunit 5 [Cynara cardunculus var. scolymus]|uniref:Transcription factor IIIC, subunit 5 n=1 Tax=Cynara cardunculus var. scolymus TaxID=59895 RepID=A0A103Y827_CYNCS|nr:Transcription factor IIIC, subunit 5 [Cynara cardunculus var. scolymus]
MGVIKDGTIAGVLPNNKLFAVNYPGYPSSMERALVTLGGAEGIAKVRQSPSNNLELHFRPEDPYSHPVIGERFPCNNFLLKISKHNTKGSQSETDSSAHLKEDEALSQGSEDKIYANIIGCVPEAYYFNGMVDYQHVLAVHADIVQRKKRNWADVEPQFEKRGLIDADQEDLMILLPPLFSVKNIPENVVLKPSIDSSTKKKQEGAMQYPEKVKWEMFIQEGTDDWNYQMAVCELFDERPIWIKQSLSEHLSDKGLKIGDNTMKMLLFVAAYYFSNGPFLKFYIRRGYDPRKDSESRMFLSVYPDPGAESLLKSASLRLGKLKRTKPVIKEQTVNEEEHQQLNRENVITEEKEMSSDEDDDGVDDDDDDDDSGGKRNMRAFSDFQVRMLLGNLRTRSFPSDGNQQIHNFQVKATVSCLV